MAKYEKDHKPTGKAAQTAALPDNLRIRTAIRTDAAKPLVGGMEEAYAATGPSVADVERLVESGVLGVMNKAGKIVAFEVKAVADKAPKSAATKSASAPAKSSDAKDDASKSDTSDAS